MKIVTALSEKRSGIPKKELVQSVKLSENGRLTQILESLEHCGFIRYYQAIGKKVKDGLYQLIDPFTLFYFRFMKDGRMRGENSWMNILNSSKYRVWTGLAFEQVCLLHLLQMKKALGISGVNTQSSSWFHPGSSEDNGIQIDLLIERADQIINLCENRNRLV